MPTRTHNEYYVKATDQGREGAATCNPCGAASAGAWAGGERSSRCAVSATTAFRIRADNRIKAVVRHAAEGWLR